MERILKKRIGRPQTDPSLRLATKAWFNFVSYLLEKSAGQLECLFASAANDKKYRMGNRPKLWERYRSGTICPRISGTAKKPSIVERVDDAVPDASRWLTSSFWRLLGNQPMDMEEIRVIFQSLMPEIRDLFVIEGYERNGVFWRKPNDLKSLVRLLLSGTFPRTFEHWAKLDAATAVLALLREAEIKQDQLQHIEVWNIWLEFPNFLREIPALQNIADEIHSILSKRMLSVRYHQEGNVLKWQKSKGGQFELHNA